MKINKSMQAVYGLIFLLVISPLAVSNSQTENNVSKEQAIIKYSNYVDLSGKVHKIDRADLKMKEVDVNADGKKDLLLSSYLFCGPAEGCEWKVYLCLGQDEACSQNSYCESFEVGDDLVPLHALSCK